MKCYPLLCFSCGLRKRRILKSSEPISVLFLASQSHKRSYLQLGDLLFYIPSMYRLISWCSDLWHLNRKDANKKQRQSRRDPNTLPGPRQGQSKKGVHSQHPMNWGAEEGRRTGAHRQLLLLSCPPERRGPCPWTEGDVAGVRGVGSTWTPGCPAGAGARDLLLSPSSIPLAAGKWRTLFPHGANLAPGPGPATGRVLTPQPRQLIPSHTSPAAQLDRDSATGSGRVKTREGHGRRHRGQPGEGFGCGHLWCGPAAQGERVGGGGGTFPCQSLQSSSPRAGNPGTRRGSCGFGWGFSTGGKDTSTAHAAVCFSAWIYHPCSKTW